MTGVQTCALPISEQSATSGLFSVSFINCILNFYNVRGIPLLFFNMSSMIEDRIGCHSYKITMWYGQIPAEEGRDGKVRKGSWIRVGSHARTRRRM